MWSWISREASVTPQGAPWRSVARLAAAGICIVSFMIPPGLSAQPAGEICGRLEADLVALDRAGPDQGSERELDRLDRAYHRQRYEHDRLLAQARQNGCGGMLFFGDRDPMCRRVEAALDRAEEKLRQLQAALSRAEQESSDPDMRREAILDALQRHGCRGETRQPRGFFARLFGGIPRLVDPRREQEDRGYDEEGAGASFYGNYRTLCVRLCDGYYWPISYSADSRLFARDTKICEATCPGQPVQLFVHRNPGEWSDDSISLDGEPLSKIPNAFVYRESYKPECGCPKPDFAIAAAGGGGQKLEGPATPIPAAARTGVRPGADGGGAVTGKAATAGTDAGDATGSAKARAAAPARPMVESDANVRTVGPTFLPAR
jgi:hypothetical protein